MLGRRAYHPPAMDPSQTVHGPRDLPELRGWLLDQWRPGGIMWPLHATGAVNGALHAKHLAGAALWWVTADMCRLIQHAGPTLPDTTLTSELVAPDDPGLVVFAEPLTGLDADGTGPITVDAILWGPAVWTGDGRLWVDISSYGATPLWHPLGGSSWRYGDGFDPLVEDYTDETAMTDARVASIIEDRRWLAALRLLAAQPLAEITTTTAARAAARRLARRGLPVDVRLIDVRRAHTPREPAEPTGDGSGRRWGHRTIVAGHWRQQACGPGWSQHRPVWIAEHVAGPDDRPLIVRDDVRVVRGSPDETVPGV